MHFSAWMIASDALKLVWRRRKDAFSVLPIPTILFALASYIDLAFLSKAPAASAGSLGGVNWAQQEGPWRLLGLVLMASALTFLSFRWQCVLLKNHGGAAAIEDGVVWRRYGLRAAQLVGLAFLGPLALAGGVPYLEEVLPPDVLWPRFVMVLTLLVSSLFLASFLYRSAFALPSLITGPEELTFKQARELGKGRGVNMFLATHVTACFGMLFAFPLVVLAMVVGLLFKAAGLALAAGFSTSIVALFYITMGTAHFSALHLGRSLEDTEDSEGGA